jgi:hypothetical protein
MYGTDLADMSSRATRRPRAFLTFSGANGT